jgi:hypothetical protein
MSRLITIVASMGGVAFLFLGFTWGEGLLSQEYISRADCLVMFFSGLGTAFCISILIFWEIDFWEIDSSMSKRKCGQTYRWRSNPL